MVSFAAATMFTVALAYGFQQLPLVLQCINGKEFPSFLPSLTEFHVDDGNIYFKNEKDETWRIVCDCDVGYTGTSCDQECEDDACVENSLELKAFVFDSFLATAVLGQRLRCCSRNFVPHVT